MNALHQMLVTVSCLIFTIMQIFYEGHLNPVFKITMIMMAVYNYFSQSSYLSQISQIIFAEKKLSCGEILGNFFEKFWEILGNVEKFLEWLKEGLRNLRRGCVDLERVCMTWGEFYDSRAKFCGHLLFSPYELLWECIALEN